jgi:hypothetical protein
MGIDFLDCCVRLEREFDLPRHALDARTLDVAGKRGVMKGATAADLAQWVAACLVALGRESPADLSPRVRGCIAATIYAATERVTPSSRIVEDLGFS